MVESMNSTQMRHIKDPIHDYISISPLMSSIIDTKEFQRLRYIKQLGVGHLARSMAEHLREKQPELDITARDVDCVQIAGLCHDLGHGPWSHVWDGLFMPAVAPKKNWKHEQGSKMMFRSLLANNNINLPGKDEEFILALIDGEPSQCSPDEKACLFDIVANKRNGLDVDKFDYIARDSYMIGEPSTLSLARLIKSARVIDNEICYDIKDLNQLHEICYTRFKLHKMIYHHKTAKAIEYMIVDALILAEPHMKITDQVDIPKKFLYLTDDLMPRIESSEEPELEGAREIFDRVRTRDLYRFVDQRVIELERSKTFRIHITPLRIVEEARRLADPHLDLTELTPDSVIVDHTTLHYGMKDKNPLDFVKFYSKRNPDTCAHAQKGDYSMLMPPIFAEVYLTIFSKHPQFVGLVQGGYRAVLKSIPDSFSSTTTEPPSTPKRGPLEDRKPDFDQREFVHDCAPQLYCAFNPESQPQAIP
ncbi:HD-domain/PDEase-like protein [Mycena venus]|uniref:HD-domain/PDEase-like protein n=1 Tax=Mycena venus TaxID=2733690 RepID=A0A8H6WYM1_9AGAR|nr:HD-domain/PDEase-like protein [Mycena venus]